MRSSTDIFGRTKDAFKRWSLPVRTDDFEPLAVPPVPPRTMTANDLQVSGTNKEISTNKPSRPKVESRNEQIRSVRHSIDGLTAMLEEISTERGILSNISTDTLDNTRAKQSRHQPPSSAPGSNATWMSPSSGQPKSHHKQSHSVSSARSDDYTFFYSSRSRPEDLQQLTPDSAPSEENSVSNSPKKVYAQIAPSAPSLKLPDPPSSSSNTLATNNSNSNGNGNSSAPRTNSVTFADQEELLGSVSRTGSYLNKNIPPRSPGRPDTMTRLRMLINDDVESPLSVSQKPVHRPLHSVSIDTLSTARARHPGNEYVSNLGASRMRDFSLPGAETVNGARSLKDLKSLKELKKLRELKDFRDVGTESMVNNIDNARLEERIPLELNPPFTGNELDTFTSSLQINAESKPSRRRNLSDSGIEYQPDNEESILKEISMTPRLNTGPISTELSQIQGLQTAQGPLTQSQFQTQTKDVQNAQNASNGSNGSKVLNPKNAQIAQIAQTVQPTQIIPSSSGSQVQSISSNRRSLISDLSHVSEVNETETGEYSEDFMTPRRADSEEYSPPSDISHSRSDLVQESEDSRRRRHRRRKEEKRSKEKARRSFSRSSIADLMNSKESRYDLDEINLPKEEKYLLDKFITTLSKLSIELQMDESKRIEGRRRLTNALKALEGWI